LMITSLHEFLNRSPSDDEIDELLNLEDSKVMELIEISKSATQRNLGKEVHCYYPGRLFPSISITGRECYLKCKHCNRHYVESMIPAEVPQKLVDLCIKLGNEGALGCLISGGFTPEAALPVREFLPALQEIKRRTKLAINIHTGFISEEVIKKLVAMGIDAISIDVVGSNDTIRNVYGLDKTVEDYAQTLRLLKSENMKNIAPHICIGLHYGELKGEGRALKIVRDNELTNLTFIALNPTKGTQMQDVKPPSALTVAKVIAVSRLMMPKISISLGCMRPSGVIRNEMDYLAILAGANRIVVPTPASLRRLEKEYHFDRHQTCCVM